MKLFWSSCGLERRSLDFITTIVSEKMFLTNKPFLRTTLLPSSKHSGLKRFIRLHENLFWWPAYQLFPSTGPDNYNFFVSSFLSRYSRTTMTNALCHIPQATRTPLFRCAITWLTLVAVPEAGATLLSQWLLITMLSERWPMEATLEPKACHTSHYIA